MPRALEKYGSLDSESLRKAADETDIPDGDTVQVYGVKFAPVGDINAGQNIRAKIQVIYQWWGGKRTVVWPSKYALEEPVVPKPAW
jgi:branched-chain amino acid transport system substrate-binding protein